MPEPDEPVGLRIRQGFEQYRIDHAEDRDIGTDAQRQRQYRDHGEDRRAAQTSHDLPQLGAEKLHIKVYYVFDCSESSFSGTFARPVANTVRNRLQRVSNRINESESDSELLQRFSQGSDTAFLALYRRHQGSVFRFSLHMSGSREVAEEVTQDVFLALLAGARQFDDTRGSLEGYLIGIARHQVRRHVKDASRQATGELFSNLLADPAPDLQRAQDLFRLRQAILSLPANYREVVVLCEVEELAYEEAARRLQCAVGTVRSRLHRARRILLAKMQRQTQQIAKQAKCSA